MSRDPAVKPSAEMSRRTRARTVIGAALVWSAWIGATVASILYIRHYARNIPFFDDFTIVPVMTGHEPLTYQWVTAQYNEHRNVIPRLIQVALLRAVPDFRAGLYLNAALLSAAAAVAILVARRLRGRTSPVDAVLPLSIITIGQCECLLVGFALNLVMTAWLAWELIGAFCRISGPAGWRPCLRVGVLLVLLPLCGGSGIAMLPPMVLWLAGSVASGWWAGRDPGVAARAVGVTLLMATSAVIAWYLTGYVRPAHIPRAPSLTAIGWTTLEVLSLVISPMGWRHPAAAGLGVVVMSMATGLLLGRVAWRSPAERPRALGLMSVLTSIGMIALSVGYSRSGLGPGSGNLSRYITIAMPLLGVNFFAWLLYGRPAARRTIHIALLVAVCAGIPSQLRSARDIGGGRRDLYVRIEGGLRRGFPTSRLLDLTYPALYRDRARTLEIFRMLKQARIGAFPNLRDELPQQAVRPDSGATVR